MINNDNCPVCKTPTKYKPSDTYQDIGWINHISRTAKVEILCPESGCCLGVIKEELPKPKRFRLQFGKYKGMRMSEITDVPYLKWMASEDRQDLLMQECAKVKLKSL